MNEIDEFWKLGNKIQIELDQFEDSLCEKLEEIRVQIRANEIAKADEMITDLINLFNEEVDTE